MLRSPAGACYSEGMMALLNSSAVLLPAGAVFVVLLCLVIAVRMRRRRGKPASSSKASAAEEERLRAELERARAAGDAAAVQAIEDRLHVLRYWERKEAGIDLPERLRKEPGSISDWNTSEKRFNNFR